MGLLTAFLATWVFFLQAAQSGAGIHGQLSDPSGAVIARATIRILDETSRRTVATTYTDAEGIFAIPGLAPGSYLIAAVAPGFEEKLASVALDAPGSAVARSIRLDVLDCDAPHVNCDIFTTGPYTDPHPVILQRNLTLRAPAAVDLESGNLVAPDSATADLRLTMQDGGLYLVPGARASISNRASDGGCGKPRVKIPSLRIDGLGPGSEIRLTMNRGRCAKIYLTQEVEPGANQAALHIVTRK